jgi:cytochrome c553
MKVQYLGPVILGVIVAVFVALSFSSSSQTSANTDVKAAFDAGYGARMVRLDSCTTCHNADFSRNAYGAAIVR